MRTFFTRKTMLTFIVALLASAYLHAQTQEATIKGKLTDEQTGEAIVGALVYIKGTKTAVQTDVEGGFEIKTSLPFPFTLSVNYVGYQAKDVEVYEEDQAVEFKIRPSSALSEVVVVGYGEQKRSDFTGSVASVAPELKAQPVVSLERILQGAVPGVQVTQTSGQPGAGSTIQIRGYGSINAGTEPLYVIDGFPFYNDNSTTDAGVSSNIGQTIGTAPKITPLSTINTSDIQSIDVLKDASATAIYGDRGANGVVIITTKRGQAGQKPVINYDGYYGIQDATHLYSLLDNKQFLSLRADAVANTKGTSYTDGLLTQIDPNVNTDWQKSILNTPGNSPIQSHSLSLSAGDEKTRVALSGSYFKQQGIVLNTPFQRFSGKLNVEHDFNSRLRVATNITGANSDAQVAPSGVVSAALLTPPVIPIKTNGAYTLNTNPFEATYGNPVNSLVNDINKSNTTLILGNISGQYKILPELSAKVLVGLNLTNNTQNQYLPSTVQEGAAAKGIATTGNVRATNWLNEYTLNYNKKLFKVHSVNALIGFTQQQQEVTGSIVSAQGFLTDITTFNDLASASTQNPSSSSYSRWDLNSFIGRLNYGYKDKYLLTLTVREDGSSKFSPGKKWGAFPSAAIAWKASNENFLKSITTISDLKLRFSVGLTGNSNIAPYQSLGRLSPYRYNFNGTNSVGYGLSQLNNPNLSWEKTLQYDLGLDISLFKNRLSLVADIYYKYTYDLLLLATLPSNAGTFNYNVAQGQVQQYINAGSIENKGIEVGVQTQNLVGELKWNTSLTFAHNENKVLSLYNNAQQFIPDNSLPSVVQVGSPVGSFIVYQTDGLVAQGTPKTQVLAPNVAGDPTSTILGLAGQQQFKDINGDGKITQADRVVINNQPIFIAGLTNNLSYKGFDLSIFFQASYGNKIFNQNAAALDLSAGNQNGWSQTQDRYTSSNTSTAQQAPYQNFASTLSSKYIEDGSYLRLKNLTLGYTLPTNLTSKFGVSALRIYVSAQNLFTVTKYTGFDPEVTSNGQGAVNSGVDNGAYPNSKTYLVGLNVTF